MGCDIHLAVEVRQGGLWERRLPPPEDRVPYLVECAAKGDAWCADAARETWYDTRNYDAFAILADVRNGRGFAGVITGEGFVPISEPRGLPSDLGEAVRRIAERDCWLGDHSYSWLSLDELDSYDWEQITHKRGVAGRPDRRLRS